MKIRRRQSLSVAAATVLGVATMAPSFAQDPPLKEKQVLETSIEVRTSNTIRMEMHAGGCKANLSLEYWQEGREARVNKTITNEECGASSGDYRILVAYRGDDGETVTDEYPETWQRDDEQPVSLTATYEIGDNVDLLRVRSRGLSCACAEPSSGEGKEDDGAGEQP